MTHNMASIDTDVYNNIYVVVDIRVITRLLDLAGIVATQEAPGSRPQMTLNIQKRR